MRTRICFAMVATAAVIPLTTSAQAPGSIEFGGFGRFTQFDPSLSFVNRAGGGARLGLFIARNVQLEGAVGITGTSSATSSVNHFPIYARLVYNLPLLRAVRFMIGAGYVHNEYHGDLRGADNGASGLAGFRLFLADAISFRFEGVGDYVPYPTNNSQGVTNNLNLGAQVGLSIHFGNYRPVGRSASNPRRGGGGDSDRDGVADRSDSCPDTPSGARVDRVGCPLPIDTDGDGVLDADDRCPNTPAGATVNESGCEPEAPTTVPESDSDGDGIVDAADACPETPTGTEVDGNGCPRPAPAAVEPAADADRDGVDDTTDACNNTPMGVTVDARGCPTDSDSDGVPDVYDRCNETAPGTYVGADGCGSMLPTGTEPVVLEGVTFDSGTAAISPSSGVVLEQLVRSLLAEPELLVEIAGHTDDTGARMTNLSLSQRRADAVRVYLIQRGVPSYRLTSRGYGPDQPIASNATEEGKSRNRRVELRRIN